MSKNQIKRTHVEEEVVDHISEKFLETFSRFQRSAPVRSDLSDLTTAEFYTLNHIFLFAGPNDPPCITFAELIPIFHKSKSAVSQILRNLESKAYIHRESIPEDRRAVMLYITPKGQAVIANRRKELRLFFHALIRDLGIEKIESSIEIMDYISQTATKNSQSDPMR